MLKPLILLVGGLEMALLCEKIDRQKNGQAKQ
jgi:hypothetical protein